MSRSALPGGWSKLSNVLDESKIVALSERLDHYEDHPERFEDALQFEREDGGQVRKMRQLHLIETDFWSALWSNAEVQQFLSKHAQEPMAVAFCAAFLKPSGLGSRVPFHQDQALWSKDLPGAFSCWVALDHADEDNGCLILGRDSHRAGVLPHEEPPGGGHPEVSADVLRRQHLEPVPLETGQAAVWDRLVVHGSRQNTSQRPRRGVVTVYAPQRLLGPEAPFAGPPALAGQ
jgi:hypothetical protein